MDHVGLSVPPVLLNHGLWSHQDQSSVFQNNNSLTVQPVTETTDATEDGHQAPSNTLLITELPANPNIPTPPKPDHAQEPEEISTLNPSALPLDATECQTPFQPNPFQSPLMLQTGQPTNQESSTTVPPQSITPSFWSVSSVDHGKSKTHGEPHGEKPDTLDLLEETPVESVLTEVSGLHDFIISIIILIYFVFI